MLRTLLAVQANQVPGDGQAVGFFAGGAVLLGLLLLASAIINRKGRRKK